MRHTQFNLIAASAFAATAALFLSACGTTTTRSLPAYEAPIARGDFQTVRTTAYTHTESDHVEYGAQNALGGRLHAASAPIHRAEVAPRALPVDEPLSSEYRTVAYTARLQPFSASTKRGSKKRSTRRSAPPKPPQIGSAAADWSRWPAGTMFRLLSTGQIYKVDDYGWALSGRNTIDLYMASRREMNTWGLRHEPIQILAWGDPEGSLQVLRSRQNHRHIKRMVLECEGNHREAAAME